MISGGGGEAIDDARRPVPGAWGSGHDGDMTERRDQTVLGL